MQLYQKYKVPAIGYFVMENNMPNVINELLIKHKPDVLVITGHDALSKSPFANEYMNSKFFLETIKNRSEFNFNVDLNSDDKILTLSTCYNDTEKMVVHAKLIKYEIKA